MPDYASPKLFISYSWSNADHESWVLELATELMGQGIEVILDKWDLKEGHDANAFMERMVTDEHVSKVILICDQMYASKANKRSGGVGAEAQIITPEIYKSQDQSKFVAVIRERDGDGKPYVPVYYSSRMYIDLSDPSSYAENFERLLRWAYDKPLHVKPGLGSKPAFLSEDSASIRLETTVLYRRALDAIKNGKDYALPALQEYFTVFCQELEKFRIDRKSPDIFDDELVKNITEFLPFRNEAVSLFTILSVYKDTDQVWDIVHKFFESLIPYLDRPRDVMSYNDTDFDNFIFIIHELFLYFIACLIKHERFGAVHYFLSKDFYIAENSPRGRDPMVSFVVFTGYCKTIVMRNQRLQLNRLSLTADIIKERCQGVGVEFDKLMVADFVLFMRARLLMPDQSWWWPDTLLYVGRFARGFEIFARAKSLSYFNKVKPIFGIDKKEDLEPTLEAMAADPRIIPRWQFDSFNPRILLSFDDIATKP